MIPIFDTELHRCVYQIDVENCDPLYFEMKGTAVLPEIIVSQKMDFGLVKTHSQAATTI